MSIKALSDYTFYSRYSRHLPEEKRRETWTEAVERIFRMHEDFFGDKLENPKFKEYFDFTKDAYKKKKALGSQRALQFGGKPILDKNMRLFNCSTTHINRPEVFQEAMWVLLCGTGLGFSVQKHHIDQLPRVHKPSSEKAVFQVPDSIEGWADAIGIIVNSYFAGSKSAFPEYAGKMVEFDYSLIRPEGAPISGGFKAPGPKGLQTSIEKIRAVLNGCGSRMKPIEAFDIICHSADAVLSGGVRRSALLTLFSPDDEEMMTAKTGNWFVENPQRGRSNNSAALLKNETSRAEFSKLMESTKEFGEPAFIWLDDKETVFNPCISADALVDARINGKSQIVRMDELVTAFKGGDDIEVNSVNTSTMERSFKSVTAADLTRKNATLIKITTESGETLKCTPDHKIWTNNRGWVEAKDLTTEDDVEIR